MGSLELCSDVHGVYALCALTHAIAGEGEHGGSGESEGETEREHGRVQIESTAPAKEVGHVSAWSGAAMLQGGHTPISMNRWRATMLARWELNWADYRPIWTLGPKEKLHPT